MKIWRYIRHLFGEVHHARTLLGLGWTGIVLALLSLATGTRLILVSMGIGIGVVALALVGIFCVLVKLANILTENGKVPAVNLTKPAATQQSVTH